MTRRRPSARSITRGLLAGIAGMVTTSLAILVIAEAATAPQAPMGTTATPPGAMSPVVTGVTSAVAPPTPAAPASPAAGATTVVPPRTHRPVPTPTVQPAHTAMGGPVTAATPMPLSKSPGRHCTHTESTTNGDDDR
jgi:hypothetical protein